MNQLPLEDVVVFMQMRTPPSTGVIAACTTTFYKLTTPSEEALAVMPCTGLWLAQTACCWLALPSHVRRPFQKVV